MADEPRLLTAEEMRELDIEIAAVTAQAAGWSEAVGSAKCLPWKMATIIQRLGAHIAAQAALLAEALAALAPLAQRYTPQPATSMAGSPTSADNMVYYTAVPADDLRRAAEVVAKLKGV